jgi:hypothetical protein
MGVAEAQQRISSHEFAEWRAYDLRDPIGPERSDMMAAVIASTVANFSGRVKRPLKHKDFMPTFGPPKRQSAEQILNAFRLAGRMSAQVAQQKKAEQAKREQKKQTKDPRTKPTDNGHRGYGKRKVCSTDRRL